MDATIQHEKLRQKQQQQDDSVTATLPHALFDDTKVYQHMLKDFVTQGAAAAAGGGDAQGTALTQRRNNTKQKSSSNQHAVDRKASKGRKIRYTEIPKLVNFTFPVSRPNNSTSDYNNLDEDAWFRSLFGGAGSLK